MRVTEAAYQDVDARFERLREARALKCPEP